MNRMPTDLLWLADEGASALIGTVGDIYENAITETAWGSMKASP